MAVTETFLVSEIVTAALRKIGVTPIRSVPSADHMAQGIEALNWMLKSWQTKGLTFAYTAGTKTLTTAASYTLSPARPVRILNARYKNTSGTETPMIRLTRDEYDSLPNKAATGIPTNFYYDRQKEAALLYVWPVLASATTESIAYTYERELEDIADQTDTLDMPVEWQEAVVYNLASRLADTFMVNADRVTMRGEMLLADLRAEDREESVFFIEGL